MNRGHPAAYWRGVATVGFVLAACSSPGPAADAGAELDGGFSESIETRCDGLDNDGDGRVDVSREVSFFAEPRPTWAGVSWAVNASGILVAHGADGGAWATLIRHDLSSQSSISLGFVPGPFFAGRVEALPDSFAVVWNTTAPDSGTLTTWVTRILADGGYGFAAAADGGVIAHHRAFTHPYDRTEARGLVASQDGSCLLVWWADSCNGWFSRGVTVSRDGVQIAAQTNLYAAPVAGICGAFRPHVLMPHGDAGFALLGLEQDGGFLMRSFDCALNELTSTPLSLAGRLPWKHVFRASPNAEKDVWLREGDVGPTVGPIAGWRLDAPEARTQLVGETGDATVNAVGVLQSPRGLYVSYALNSSTTGTRVVAHSFDGGNVRSAFEAEAEWVPFAEPLSLPLDADHFLVGHVADAADGNVALRARVVCAP